MKKQLSVFALHARAAIGRLALVLLGMLALDAAAYALFGLRGFRASLTGSELVTALRVIFSLGLVACQLLLASCFGAGSRYGYTLRRLQIPETRVLLWSGVGNALCFACVWCVQLMASVGTAALHAADARYAEALEAVFPHEYLESAGERWNLQTLEISPMRTGAHTKDGRGFVVDESGCVVRENGLFTSGGWTYLSDTDTGCIFADGALHRTDGHVVLSLRGGQLLQDGAQGEYLFDENGYYTTGSEEIDVLLDEAIAACTTQDMTPEQMLRACYDYVRSYKYLGRNAAFGADVKTPPYEKLLEFAQEILSTGKGDCYNFAASFCLLSRRLGFEAACIIGECGYVWNWRPIAHGWVEITKDGQTLLYDPQIENYNIRAGISNDDYGAYGVRYETAHARYLKH